MLEGPPTNPDAVLDELKECQAPSAIPVLRAERLVFAAPSRPELRAALELELELEPEVERAELLTLPNECHWPSLIADRVFDERPSNELRPLSAPRDELPPIP